MIAIDDNVCDLQEGRETRPAPLPYLLGDFPVVCSGCGETFPTIGDYVDHHDQRRCA